MAAILQLQPSTCPVAFKQELEQPAQQEAKRLRWDSSDGAEEEEDDTSEELDTGGQPLMVIHTSFVDVSMGAAGAPLMRQRCICCKVIPTGAPDYNHARSCTSELRRAHANINK